MVVFVVPVYITAEEVSLTWKVLLLIKDLELITKVMLAFERFGNNRDIWSSQQCLNKGHFQI
jgi:hypothetical protein